MKKYWLNKNKPKSGLAIFLDNHPVLDKFLLFGVIVVTFIGFMTIMSIGYLIEVLKDGWKHVLDQLSDLKKLPIKFKEHCLYLLEVIVDLFKFK